MLLHNFLRNVITKFLFWIGVLSTSEAAQVRDMNYETVMTVFPTCIALAYYWEAVKSPGICPEVRTCIPCIVLGEAELTS